MEKKVIYSLLTLSALSTGANAAAIKTDAYDFTKVTQAQWGNDATFTNKTLTVSNGATVQLNIGKLKKGSYALTIKVNSEDADQVIVKIAGQSKTIAKANFNTEQTVSFTLAAETDVTLELSTSDVNYTDKLNPAAGNDGWKGSSGLCSTEFAPAVEIKGRDGEFQLAEKYETNVNTTGDLITQTITDIPNGKYTVTIYANAFFTSGRGFDSDMADGATDVCYVFAGKGEQRVQQFIAAKIATKTEENARRTMTDVEVTDGTLIIGLGKAKAGTNWHTIQAYEITPQFLPPFQADGFDLDLDFDFDAAVNSTRYKAQTVQTAIAGYTYDTAADKEEIDAIVNKLAAMAVNGTYADYVEYELYDADKALASVKTQIETIEARAAARESKYTDYSAALAELNTDLYNAQVAAFAALTETKTNATYVAAKSAFDAAKAAYEAYKDGADDAYSNTEETFSFDGDPDAVNDLITALKTANEASATNATKNAENVEAYNAAKATFDAAVVDYNKLTADSKDKSYTAAATAYTTAQTKLSAFDTAVKNAYAQGTAKSLAASYNAQATQANEDFAAANAAAAANRAAYNALVAEINEIMAIYDAQKNTVDEALAEYPAALKEAASADFKAISTAIMNASAANTSNMQAGIAATQATGYQPVVIPSEDDIQDAVDLLGVKKDAYDLVIAAEVKARTNQITASAAKLNEGAASVAAEQQTASTAVAAVKALIDAAAADLDEIDDDEFDEATAAADEAIGALDAKVNNANAYLAQTKVVEDLQTALETATTDAADLKSDDEQYEPAPKFAGNAADIQDLIVALSALVKTNEAVAYEKDYGDEIDEINQEINEYKAANAAAVVRYNEIQATLKGYQDALAATQKKIKAGVEVYDVNYKSDAVPGGYKTTLDGIAEEIGDLAEEFAAALALTDDDHLEALIDIDEDAIDFIAQLAILDNNLGDDTTAYQLNFAKNSQATSLAAATASYEAQLESWNDLSEDITDDAGKLGTAAQENKLKQDLAAIKNDIDAEKAVIDANTAPTPEEASAYNMANGNLVVSKGKLDKDIAQAITALRSDYNNALTNVEKKAEADEALEEITKDATGVLAVAKAKVATDYDHYIADWSAIEEAIAEQEEAIEEAYEGIPPTLADDLAGIKVELGKIKTAIADLVEVAKADQEAYVANEDAYNKMMAVGGGNVQPGLYTSVATALTTAYTQIETAAKAYYKAILDGYAEDLAGIEEAIEDGRDATVVGTAKIEAQKNPLEKLLAKINAVPEASLANQNAFNAQTTQLANLKDLYAATLEKINAKLVLVQQNVDDEGNPTIYEDLEEQKLQDLLDELEPFNAKIEAIDLLDKFISGASVGNSAVETMTGYTTSVQSVSNRIDKANEDDIDQENTNKFLAFSAAIELARTKYTNGINTYVVSYKSLTNQTLKEGTAAALNTLSQTLYDLSSQIDAKSEAGTTAYTAANPFFDYNSELIKDAINLGKAVDAAIDQFKADVAPAIDEVKAAREDYVTTAINEAKNGLIFATDAEKAALVQPVQARWNAVATAAANYLIKDLDDALNKLGTDQEILNELNGLKWQAALDHYSELIDEAIEGYQALSFDSEYDDIDQAYAEQVEQAISELEEWKEDILIDLTGQIAFMNQAALQAAYDKYEGNTYIADHQAEVDNQIAQDEAAAEARAELAALQLKLNEINALAENFGVDAPTIGVAQTQIDNKQGQYHPNTTGIADLVEAALTEVANAEQTALVASLQSEYMKAYGADADEAVESFKKNVDELIAAINALHVGTPASLITNANQFSSPFSQNDFGNPDGGNLADGVLIDNNQNTYWHSVWTGGAVAGGTHYLQVEMPDGDYESVAFQFTRRPTLNDHTIKWTVMGTNTANAEKTACEELAVIETPYGGNTETLTSEAFDPKGYTYLRFYSDEQHPSTRGYFHISEFQLLLQADEPALLVAKRDEAAELITEMMAMYTGIGNDAALSALNESVLAIQAKSNLSETYPDAAPEFEDELDEITEALAKVQATIIDNQDRILFYQEDLALELDKIDAALDELIEDVADRQEELDAQKALSETRYAELSERYAAAVSQFQALQATIAGYAEVHDVDYDNNIAAIDAYLEDAEEAMEDKANLYKNGNSDSYKTANKKLEWAESGINNLTIYAAYNDLKAYIEDLTDAYEAIDVDEADYSGAVWQAIIAKQLDILGDIEALTFELDELYDTEDEQDIVDGYADYRTAIDGIFESIAALAEQVEKSTLGDANKDGSINVADYRTIINHVLDGAAYIADYDINEDDEVNVVDATAVVNLILTGNIYGEVNNFVRAYDARSMKETLVLETQALENGNVRMAINLNNVRSYTSFQLDVVLPEGLKLVGQSLGERAGEGHNLLTNEISGAVRIIGTSIQNEVFEGGSGAVLYLTFERTDAYKGGEVAFENIIFSDANAKGTRFNLKSASLTGINGTSIQSIVGRIYDIGGRLMNTMKRGINIIRNNDSNSKVLK